MTDRCTEVLSGFCYLEAPRWRDGRIWVSDFYLGKVFSALPDGSQVRVEADVPGQPSGLGWLPDGRLLVVSMVDRRILRREPDGTLVTHADLAGHFTTNANDMVVDDAGRAYVGSFGFDLGAGADFAPSVLVRVDPDGETAVVADDLWFPNGPVLIDGTLLVNETFGNRVTAFDVAADGSLDNRRIWAQFGERPTATRIDTMMSQIVVGPDGACLSPDGDLWVADARFGRALRVREGGEIIDEVQVGSGVFACGLGDDTLYLCVAPDFNAAARSAERAGRLLAVRV